MTRPISPSSFALNTLPKALCARFWSHRPDLPVRPSEGEEPEMLAMPQQPDVVAPTAAQRTVRAVRRGVLE